MTKVAAVTAAAKAEATAAAVVAATAVAAIVTAAVAIEATAAVEVAVVEAATAVVAVVAAEAVEATVAIAAAAVVAATAAVAASDENKAHPSLSVISHGAPTNKNLKNSSANMAPSSNSEFSSTARLDAQEAWDSASTVTRNRARMQSTT